MYDLYLFLGFGVFRNGTAVAVVNSNQIDQTSGMCASRSHPGYLYTHNDHGDGSHIYVLDSKTGHRISTITIRGAHNADWEDIACGPCPGGENCIYIGNLHQFSIAKKQTIWNESNCETLLVDPKGEVYLISRASGMEVNPKIAHEPLTGWNSHANVVLKDLVNLNIRHALVVLALSASNPITVPYIQETKGEAVSWDNHGNGYFTLGEGHDQTLYYYGRNTDIVG
ncbi:uncharacterized protein LOC143053665 [Mytilus galloprovincialis]|uniref:uncharacterized protein LOC143053665 n=1 Tax=Mytilus galloprovincialis TaxID=29158 RepID=UPI003F7BA874